MKLPEPGFEHKIVNLEALKSKVGDLARPIVFTNGVFDILHRGHVTYLAQARMLGASLVIGVNSDASVRLLGKGEDRPLNQVADRVALLAALESVTLVTIFEESIPLKPLEIVRPEVYVKGGDYDMSVIPEGAILKQWSGRAVAIEFEHERSTTSFLARARARA